jgi:hypothetical protein
MFILFAVLEAVSDTRAPWPSRRDKEKRKGGEEKYTVFKVEWI